FLSFPVVLLLSCSGKNTYTIETFYSSNKNTGDTTLTSKKDNITADTDSAAYVKANDQFNKLTSKSGDNNGMPVKFTIRNHEGVIVIAPGQDSTQQDRNMYPNQKSPD
ncbi:MAG: hypothetical protein ABIQ31_24420, partial [Ferruginibacter sp.]